MKGSGMRPQRILVLSVLCATAFAQTPVAPTPEPVGKSRGEDRNGYNIVNSFETGYRFRTVDGNLGKYRSDVNYGNGIRLLSGNLSVNSKDGRGRLFDEIVLSTLGLGNDPYQFATLRIQKNGLYRYDMQWRLNEYYNPALTISSGAHLMDTRRRLQDHDLTLLPQSRIRFLLGYTRNSQDGPALSTVQQFGSGQDEFPVFANIHRVRNEYRLGAEALLLGTRITVMHGWDNFKEETPYGSNQTEPGFNPNDRITLNLFNRTEPYHGNTPYWRLGLTREQGKWLAVHGRFNYAIGRRDFLFDESATGTDRSGLARDRQILVAGSGSRPVASGSLTLSLFPGARLTVTNHTAFHSTRMEGENTYRELINSQGGFTSYDFNYLGIRTIANATDANYRAMSWLTLYAGYRYSARQIRSVERQGPVPSPDDIRATQDNHLNSGLAGFRLRPIKPLTINLDAEVGRADRPLYPISEKRYHALNGRVQYKMKSLLLSGATRTSYNTNSVSFSAHSSRSRNYSVNASWAPLEWFSFDAGYSKIHLDTISGLAYFSSSQLVAGRSLYISNIHALNGGIRVSIRKKADLFAGYNRVQDRGDGRSGLVAADAFMNAQTFPLSFTSPLARLSIPVWKRMRLNFGYQYYDYGERFYTRQNYRAHTGYSSVLWSF
jgi:hypothetical protein